MAGERERLCKFLRNALHDDADKAADLLEADAAELAAKDAELAELRAIREDWTKMGNEMIALERELEILREGKK